MSVETVASVGGDGGYLADVFTDLFLDTYGQVWQSVETVASIGGVGYVADVFTELFLDTYGRSGVAATLAMVGA